VVSGTARACELRSTFLLGTTGDISSLSRHVQTGAETQAEIAYRSLFWRVEDLCQQADFEKGRALQDVRRRRQEDLFVFIHSMAGLSKFEPTQVADRLQAEYQHHVCEM
jgi:hypothetical protein